MNLNFNLEKSFVFWFGTDVYGLRKCNYGKILEIHFWNKMNQIIRHHSQRSYLSVCWNASENISPEIRDIFENSCGTVEIYRMRKKTLINSVMFDHGDSDQPFR